MIFFAITIISLVFIAIAFGLNEENAGSLLAGYNTLSNEKKKQIDLKPLLKDLKKFNLFLGLSLFVFGLIIYFFTNEFIVMMFMTTYPIVGLIYFNIKSKKHFLSETMRKDNTTIYLLIGVLLFTIGIMSLKLLK